MKKLLFILSFVMTLSISCKKDDLKNAPDNCIRVTKKIKEVVHIGNYDYVEYYIKYKKQINDTEVLMKISEERFNNVNVNGLICGLKKEDFEPKLTEFIQRPNMIKTFK